MNQDATPISNCQWLWSRLLIEIHTLNDKVTVQNPTDLDLHCLQKAGHIRVQQDKG